MQAWAHQELRSELVTYFDGLNKRLDSTDSRVQKLTTTRVTADEGQYVLHEKQHNDKLDDLTVSPACRKYV